LKDVLKQRLLGALILIALGVLFWPFVFVDSDRVPLDRTSQVPTMPALEQMRIDTPQPLQDLQPTMAATEIRLHDQPPELELQPAADFIAEEPVKIAQAEEPKTASRPQPKLDDAGIPVAWVLQVISVSKRSKAEALTNELIALGYKAYHRPLKRDQNTLYRIYVGPVFDRNKLEQTKLKLDKHLHVDAIVARYLP
jgi:DedD protein